MAVVVRYSHRRPSLLPLALSAEEMALVARAVRSQACCIPHRPKVDMPSVMRRLSHLIINDVPVELRLRVDASLSDEVGTPVLGLTEHDPQHPQRIHVALNGGIIGEDDTLAVSTLIHEAAHAIFDGPAWIVQAKQVQNTPARRQRFLRTATWSGSPTRCWSEWRANEFMGAFLTPRSLLHQWMVKRAAALGVPMDPSDDPSELPIIRWSKRYADRTEAMILELAEIFGLSVSFIETRLAKYRLIRAR